MNGTEDDDFSMDEDAPRRRPPGRGFDEITARYYEAKCREALQDEDDASQEPSERVVIALMTTAAELPRQVMVKITIFEAELTAECEDGPWLDHRILPMFAGLKADLIRFGVGRDQESGDGPGADR